MQMLQHSLTQIHKNNFLFNPSPITTSFQSNWTKKQKTIQDYQRRITPISAHLSFIQHICSSMKSRSINGNEQMRRMRERDNKIGFLRGKSSKR